jgi:hypothetical protein
MVAIVASKVNNCFYWQTESGESFSVRELNDAELADALMKTTAPLNRDSHNGNQHRPALRGISVLHAIRRLRREECV